VRRLRRPPANPTGEMSILEHIAELRSRLVKSAIALVVTTTAAFTPPVYDRVLNFVTRSYCDLPARLRIATAAGDATCGLAALSPLEPLSIRVRVSLTVGLLTALIASLIGLAIGLVSGFVRWSDGIIMRVMDGGMSIPPVLLAIAFMALSRASVGNVIMAITIAEIPRVARLVRSVVLSLREQPFVDAAIASGTTTPGIILRHILPNTLPSLTVQATYICASAMVTEAILSFIGAGTPSAIPSWGNIIADGSAIWQIKPALIFIPAAFLSATVLAVNILGDGLRDALDPRRVRAD
jgi:ABC-type dipeptide/oligopeptide/nickel transport system permease subunit